MTEERLLAISNTDRPDILELIAEIRRLRAKFDDVYDSWQTALQQIRLLQHD